MEKTPKKVRVLTRLKINEVSAVDRGAGENCKVVISKRDGGSAAPAPLTNAEMARAKLEGRLALRHAEEQAERDRLDDRSGPLFDKFYKIFSKRAAVARGDEADATDEETHVDKFDVCPKCGKRHADGDEHHVSKRQEVPNAMSTDFERASLRLPRPSSTKTGPMALMSTP